MGSSNNSMPQQPIEIAKVNKNAPEIYKECKIFDHLYKPEIFENKVDQNLLLQLHLEKFNNNFLFFIKKQSLNDINFEKIEKLKQLTDKDYLLKKRLAGDENTQELTIDKESDEKHVYMCRHFVIGLSENIACLKNIQVLQCCCNYITKIPYSIKYLKNLKMLILSRNRIKELPEELGCCKELRELDLSDNLIEKIPNSIAALKSLNVLHLSKNKIKNLNPAIGKLSALKSLFIDNNEIEYVPLEVLKLPFLSQLVTDSNNLHENISSSIIKIGEMTLVEECYRKIIRNNYEIPRNLPVSIKKQIISVKECAFCGGPFFDFFYEVKAMHEFDGLLYPTKYKMCTKHYDSHEKRIEALFASSHKRTKPLKLIESNISSVTELFEPFCHSEEFISDIKEAYDVNGKCMPLVCLSLYNSNFFKKYVLSRKRVLPKELEEKKKRHVF
ncbi:LRRC58 [Ecytonucleospora hepatopenaei]|uniref:LRRC58 n=1 Tax=Ecytonucleospora hepatopenaei TaxID=646526 RepID=A0A1W0E8E6_9MICR|nr:LRRC58 [Ecytonucleospora hepatopenaei]